MPVMKSQYNKYVENDIHSMYSRKNITNIIMSILSIFDKFDDNKIHNYIDNILHNFSFFFMIYYFYYYILLLLWHNYYENCKIDLYV